MFNKSLNKHSDCYVECLGKSHFKQVPLINMLTSFAGNGESVAAQCVNPGLHSSINVNHQAGSLQEPFIKSSVLPDRESKPADHPWTVPLRHVLTGQKCILLYNAEAFKWLNADNIRSFRDDLHKNQKESLILLLYLQTSGPTLRKYAVKDSDIWVHFGMESKSVAHLGQNPGTQNH